MNSTNEKSAPIRVCFVIDRLIAGGTELQLLQLIRYLDRTRIQPYLCILKGQNDYESRSMEPRDCTVVRLNVRKLRSFSAARQAWQFIRFLWREKINVVQTYFPESTYFAFVAGRLAGVPRIIGTRRNTGYWMTSADRHIARMVSPRLDAIIANCNACRRAVIEQEGANPARVHVIPNGIELERFTHLPPCDGLRDGRSRKIGMLANFRPVKGIDVFLRAAALVVRRRPDSFFELAGDGDRTWVERVIEECDIQNHVRLLGRIENVPDWLGTLDIAVLASRAEGLSNALLEYMAAGRAIVATRVGGNPDVIENNKTGLLVEPDDEMELADAIERLLADGPLRGRLGQAARKSAVSSFAGPAVAKLSEVLWAAQQI